MMGLGMVAGMLLFWIVLIILAVLLVQRLFQPNQSTDSDLESSLVTPREILNQRYARGEITQGQFLQMKKDLH